MDAGPTPNLRHDPRFVDEEVLAPVQLDDPRAPHALAEVLVRACR